MNPSAAEPKASHPASGEVHSFSRIQPGKSEGVTRTEGIFQSLLVYLLRPTNIVLAHYGTSGPLDDTYSANQLAAPF